MKKKRIFSVLIIFLISTLLFGCEFQTFAKKETQPKFGYSGRVFKVWILPLIFH